MPISTWRNGVRPALPYTLSDFFKNLFRAVSELKGPARPQHIRSRIARDRQVAKKTQGDAVIVAGILKMPGADAISARLRTQRAGRKRRRVSNWFDQGGIKNVKSSLSVDVIAALQNLHVTLGALCGLATGREFVRNCSKKTENICRNGFERIKKNAYERFHSSEFRSRRLKADIGNALGQRLQFQLLSTAEQAGDLTDAPALAITADRRHGGEPGGQILWGRNV